MPIDLVGNSGITTPGMESTAMPTVGGDAVVESGSNSDGEWTRWADGTQFARAKKVSSGATDAVGSIYRSQGGEVVTFVHPAPFVGDYEAWAAARSTFTWASPTAFNAGDVTVYRLSAVSNSSNADILLLMVGRWK